LDTKNGGLCSEDSYPYISQSQECQTECSLVPKSQIQSWVDVEPTDQALMNAIAQQPVSIAIEADQLDFQLYESGVFTGKCGTTLDHGVLVVGYGTENAEDYYLVKTLGELLGEIKDISN
jgi:Papain family cysteine protease.